MIIELIAVIIIFFGLKIFLRPVDDLLKYDSAISQKELYRRDIAKILKKEKRGGTNVI